MFGWPRVAGMPTAENENRRANEEDIVLDGSHWFVLLVCFMSMVLCRMCVPRVISCYCTIPCIVLFCWFGVLADCLRVLCLGRARLVPGPRWLSAGSEPGPPCLYAALPESIRFPMR